MGAAAAGGEAGWNGAWLNASAMYESDQLSFATSFRLSSRCSVPCAQIGTCSLPAGNAWTMDRRGMQRRMFTSYRLPHANSIPLSQDPRLIVCSSSDSSVAYAVFVVTI